MSDEGRARSELAAQRRVATLSLNLTATLDRRANGDRKLKQCACLGNVLFKNQAKALTTFHVGQCCLDLQS